MKQIIQSFKTGETLVEENQRTEVREQRTEDRDQRAENRGQRTEINI
jgi:hypothetical protein